MCNVSCKTLRFVHLHDDDHVEWVSDTCGGWFDLCACNKFCEVQEGPVVVDHYGFRGVWWWTTTLLESVIILRADNSSPSL